MFCDLHVLKNWYCCLRIDKRNKTRRRFYYRRIEKEKLRLAELGSCQACVKKYCPSDRDPEEFVDRLAIGAIALVEDVAKKTGLTVDEILSRFYWDDLPANTN